MTSLSIPPQLFKGLVFGCPMLIKGILGFYILGLRGRIMRSGLNCFLSRVENVGAASALFLIYSLSLGRVDTSSFHVQTATIADLKRIVALSINWLETLVDESESVEA